MAVVAYHAGVLRGGYVGVDIFFVVSGYLITRLLWRELTATQRVSFASFYARRARRLLPMSVVVLVATLLAARVWLPPLQVRDVGKDATAAAAYVANYRFLAQRTDYLAPHAASPFQHYWSLGVEEQFYAAWPLVLFAVAWAARRLRLRGRAIDARAAIGAVASVAVLSFAVSVHLTATSQPWAFFSLPARAWELLVGALLALVGDGFLIRSKRQAAVLGWIGLGAVAFAVTRFDSATAFPGFAAAVPVLGTAALLVAGGSAPRRGASLALAHSVPQRVGRISYAWYLWHWPMLTLAPAALGHALSRVDAVLVAALSGVVAWISTVVVERPIRFSRSLAGWPRRSIALGVVLTAVALVTSVAIVDTMPPLTGHASATALRVHLPSLASPGADVRVHHVKRVAATVTPTRSPLDVATAVVRDEVRRGVATAAVPSNLEPALVDAHASKAEPFNDGCDNTFTDATVHTCAYGVTRSPTTIVLFGDSHAAQWFPPLHALALFRHWRLVNLTKATCPPMVMSIWSPVLARPFRECDAWRAQALARIRQERPAVVVVGVARHYGPEYRFQVFDAQWINGLRDLVRNVAASGTSVVVLGPTPKPPFDVPDCVSAHVNDVPACTFARGTAVNATGEAAERAAVRAAGGRYLDVPSLICTTTTCAAIVGNLLVYRDDNHLTTEYTTWLAPVFAAQLDEAWPRARR